MRETGPSNASDTYHVYNDFDWQFESFLLFNETLAGVTSLTRFGGNPA